MAIQKCIRIMVTAVADGESTQFSCDLVNDPYWVGSSTTSGAGGDVMNWLADPDRGPTDVRMVSGAEGANMAGSGSSVVIIDVLSRDAGWVYEVILDVIFP